MMTRAPLGYSLHLTTAAILVPEGLCSEGTDWG